MSVKLEDVLTNPEIVKEAQKLQIYGDVGSLVRACIRLTVEKAEKVEGCVGIAIDQRRTGGFYFNEGPPNSPSFRHALLLLGPRYEPKPVKSAEERIEEALKAYDAPVHCYRDTLAFEMARILRGESK